MNVCSTPLSKIVAAIIIHMMAILIGFLTMIESICNGNSLSRCFHSMMIMMIMSTMMMMIMEP